MVKIENLEVFNFEGALRGMRNPRESWERSDSQYEPETFKQNTYIIGPNDMKLAQNLIKSGQDDRKYLRQILVSMDITASMSFWWDIDTYKIATEKNSTSRMHKFTSRNCRPLTQEDFNWKNMSIFRETVLIHCNCLITQLRDLLDNDISIMAPECQKVFEELTMDLPAGYEFKRTWTGNYEVLNKLYHARKNHKQIEIRDFCKIIETLPYAKEFITN